MYTFSSNKSCDEDIHHRYILIMASVITVNRYEERETSGAASEESAHVKLSYFDILLGVLHKASETCSLGLHFGILWVCDGGEFGHSRGERGRRTRARRRQTRYVHVDDKRWATGMTKTKSRAR